MDSAKWFDEKLDLFNSIELWWMKRLRLTTSNISIERYDEAKKSQKVDLSRKKVNWRIVVK